MGGGEGVYLCVCVCAFLVRMSWCTERVGGKEEPRSMFVRRCSVTICVCM